MNLNKITVRVLFVILAFMAISTMVNAPGIGYGYGLVVLVMILAAWMFNPLEAFIYLFISEAIATFMAMETSSAFLTIFLLSNILRPFLASLGSFLKRRYGEIRSGLTIVALDSILALTIATLYYGNDGIHSAFSIYEFVWIPFSYVVYKSMQNGNKVLGLTTTLLLSFSYILSIFAFFSIAPLLASTIGLLVLLYAFKKNVRKTKYYYAFVISLIVAGIVAGGMPLRLNAKVMLYPFEPKSWSNSRWSVHSYMCGNISNAFEGVHDPSRLRIVKGCVTLLGKVEGLPIRFQDGDYCFDLKVINSSYPISIGGHILRHGYVHVEIIPRNQAELLRKINGGLCPGDVVKVKGTYVIDTDHGLWSEVHPVFEIEVLNRTSSWPQCIWSYVQEKAKEYSSSG